MKIYQFLAVAALGLLVSTAHGQNKLPEGFKKGVLGLANGTNVQGYVKENIRKNASIWFIENTGDKKQVYHGADIAAVEIEGDRFICKNGDFFKLLSEGELSFLQKASDASGKPVYNGTEASFTGGTEGNIGDYFIYRSADKQLRHLSQKNLDQVVNSCFSGDAVAAEKARSAGNDLARVKEAVEIYNNRSK